MLIIIALRVKFIINQLCYRLREADTTILLILKTYYAIGLYPDAYKMNMVFQDIARKKANDEELARAGKFK